MNQELSVNHQHQFIKPYPQQALGGQEGLTSDDIAQSLGVNPKHVAQKLRRGLWRKCPEWQTSAYTDQHPVNGQPIIRYALNTRAAKAFVARWGNEIGDSFLSFLFDCEEIVLKRVGPMIEEIARLRSQVTALTRPRFRQKGEAMVEVMKRVVSEKTMFGEWDRISSP